MIQSPLDAQSMDIFQQLDTLMADSFPSAKSQMQRHISNNASIQRKRASRVSKTSSAGSSPQNYQRRRHTTSQTIPRQRRAIYQQCLQTPPSSTQFMSSARPVSWHPSSMAYQQQQQPPQIYTTNFPYGIPTPMTYTNTSVTPQQGWYNIEDPSGFYQQSADYDCHNLNVMTPNHGNYFMNNYLHETSAVFSPVLYSGSAAPGTLSTYTTHTAPATPDFLPTETTISPQRPMLSRTNSKELVGMGLYDGPDRNSWTLDNYMDRDSTTRPLSLGKGLKLEDAWEPPEEEDKTDDEDEEEEEGEQVEETIQQQLEQVAKEVPQLPPMDMNGQSFFFTPQDHIGNPQAGFVQYMMPSYGTVL